MFILDNIKILDIEITTACNAACPWCARELPEVFNFDKKRDHDEITFDQFKNWFDEDIIRHVDKIQFCGNFGDPAAAKDLLGIIRYIKSIDPTTAVGLNSNGGLRSAEWWRELATLLIDQKDYVVFSIDGLEDTNHLYRKNVRWKKLMENSKAYINAGGNAHWDMLIFDHNQHQMSECQNLAKEMGFRYFRKKVSERPKGNFFTLKPIKPYDKSVNIDCMALNQRSIFVSACGLCLPCCVIGSYVYDNKLSKNHPDILIREELDLNKNEIRSIIPRLNKVVDTWHTSNPVDSCIEACNYSVNKMEDLFKAEIKLD